MLQNFCRNLDEQLQCCKHDISNATSTEHKVFKIIGTELYTELNRLYTE